MNLFLQRCIYIPALSLLLVGVVFSSFGALTAHASTTSVSDQMVLIQKLLAQIESLRKVLMTMQSGGNTSAGQTGICLEINNNMGYRSTGNEVSALQDFLQTRGFLSSAPTGFYGLMTTGAVQSFQRNYGIDDTGYFGTETRAKVRALTCMSDSSSASMTATPKIYTAAFDFSVYAEKGTIVVSGSNLTNATKLEYGANCCKPLEGTLQRVLLKDGKAYFALDSYLESSENNGQLESLTVRVVDPVSGKTSNWEDVKGYPTTVESGDAPEIIYFKTTDTNILKGENVTLSWSTNDDAANCDLGIVTAKTNEWLRNIGSATSYKINPQETTKYTLSCRGRYTDSNGNYPEVKKTLTVTVTPDDLSVTASLTTLSQFGYTTTSMFQFTVENWRQGLVMDVEPYVHCPNNTDCSHYLMDITQKAGAESYSGEKGDPYVKGGALYRFSDTGAIPETIQISSYPDPDYDGDVLPYAISVDYRFILRDLNNGAKDVWSKEWSVINKG